MKMTKYNELPQAQPQALSVSEQLAGTVLARAADEVTAQAEELNQTLASFMAEFRRLIEADFNESPRLRQTKK